MTTIEVTTRAVTIETTAGPKGPQGDVGPQGLQGIQGETGPQGPPGVGVPAGGVVGEVLQKIDGTDYNAAWGAVALDSLAHIPNHKLLGRHTAGDGNVQTIGLDGGLEFNGSNIRREAFTGGDVTASAGSNVLSIVDALKNAWDGAVAWISTNGANLLAHLSNTSNPHNTTAAQVGLGNVNNTADLDKPVSTAQAAAIAAREPIYLAGLRAGNWFSPAYTHSRTVFASTGWNGSLFLYPRIIPTAVTISKLSLYIPTAIAGGSFQIGVYVLSGTTLTRVASATGLSAAAIAQVEVSIAPVTLPAGTIFFAVQTSGATVAIRGLQAGGLVTPFPIADASTLYVYSVSNAFGSFPLTIAETGLGLTSQGIIPAVMAFVSSIP